MILVTGCAGFIGFHTSLTLLKQGKEVVGIDNLNEYYDPILKHARLKQLQAFDNFIFYKLDIINKESVVNLAIKHQKIEYIIHLAAQAGVRYSIENPHAYVDSNVTGHLNILELSKTLPGLKHLVYASTSSVYGANTKMPFSVDDRTDSPISLYAATKKCCELMTHAYAHLFKIPSTGLRFFTVYGPWGRPDMAAFIFANAILNDQPIPVYNNGEMRRNFTYIDDIVEGVIRVIDNPAQENTKWDGNCPDPGTSLAPYRIYNIGNNNPVSLLNFIETLEKCLGKEANKNFLPLQPGDVPDTYADVSDLVSNFGYKPNTLLEIGVRNFVEWYEKFYRKN